MVHGILGETKIFAHARIEPERTRLMLRLVWQCGTVASLGVALLLFIAPLATSGTERDWIVAVRVVTFGFAAVANAWATAGRHFGWMILTAVVALSLAGR